MITWAQQYVPAATTVVLASTTPIFAFLITWGITRHEPATLLKLAGAMLGLAGTAVIIGLDALGGLSSNLFAEIVILLATVSFACATIFGLRLSDYDPMVVAAGSLLFGGTLLLPVALVVEHPWTLHPTHQALIAATAMGIFSSALGLMLFYMCLGRLGTLTTNAQGYCGFRSASASRCCCSAKPCRRISRSAWCWSWPASRHDHSGGRT